MPIIYNAGEVYSMGIEIEKNGKDFYLKAAAATSDQDLQKFFKSLADWEEKHISLFQKMKSELSDASSEDNTEGAVFDPDNEYNKYLKAAADSHIFLKKVNIQEIVSKCQTPADLLKIALQFEKDSVVLYSSLKDLVPEYLGKDKVSRLVQEELNHIAIIQGQLDNLK